MLGKGIMRKLIMILGMVLLFNFVSAEVLTTIRIHFDCGFGKNIYIVGDNNALDNFALPGKAGEWTPGNIWIYSTKEIAAGQIFNWKSVIGDKEDNFSYEKGANHISKGGDTIDIFPAGYESSTKQDVWKGRINIFKVDGYKDIPGRNVTVVLPPYYDKSKSYPVLYLQDGNNCLDNDPFGNGGWKSHRTVDYLVRSNKIEPIILVLIENFGDGGSGQRVYEYSPVADPMAKFFYNGTVGGGADNYIGLIINKIIPEVEKQYSVKSGKENRAIGGSSFGGLLSFYAGLKYSSVFGKSICMSSYFVWKSNWIVNFTKNTSKQQGLKIYIDSGDKSSIPIFKDDGKSVTEDVRKALVSKGYTDKELKHAYFQGNEHSEKYWQQRFDVPIKFMFGK